MVSIGRVAVVDRERCKGGSKCDYVCQRFCPGVKTGRETITIDEDTNKPVISEELCSGCGICTQKCPFGAIKVVRLPEELEGECVHKYEEGGFRLYRLPVPKPGKVTGVIGRNAIGKTTAAKILTGELKPNLGDPEADPDWDEVIRAFSGTELQEHFRRIANGDLRPIMKPQYVEILPKVVEGRVKDALEDVDELGVADELIERLGLTEVTDRRISDLSGGELQRVAIAAALSRDADFLVLDEPCSYLDVEQRLSLARLLREIAEDRGIPMLVIEHDLATLDYVADVVHVFYGKRGAYGVVSKPMGVGKGINAYLKGYLEAENVRFRDDEVVLPEKPVEAEAGERDTLVEYGELVKEYDGNFRLEVEPGEIRVGEIIGALGPNAIGKTTFVKLLAGVLEPTEGKVDVDIKVSYKPQYLKVDSDEPVEQVLRRTAGSEWGSSWYRSNIVEPLDLEYLFDRPLCELSGGELQRVAVAAALSREADLYLLDEPSAYLDVEERINTARVIRRVIETRDAAAVVVDHDLLLIDYISDRMMVFEGEPGKHGRANPPESKREAMNRFLSNLGVTFRRDQETRRPRANKPGSHRDRKQKRRGEYFYA
ncbi:ribosome biogenesis/translation initiation ATPase RLI [Methanopyrus sp. KOL6]|uniref:ribosome biogenesis/translation initiation ATPase RLI n=1 Tax=Methanopyrus sp. KOL6 TaxID=1937004 RepID=UPI000B4B8260|nr:ribosome biogenesis/translation initiation ATPase RLI [Methanopyrus sp. KOL6]